MKFCRLNLERRARLICSRESCRSFPFGHVKTSLFTNRKRCCLCSVDDLHLIYEWLVDETMSFKSEDQGLWYEEKKAQRKSCRKGLFWENGLVWCWRVKWFAALNVRRLSARKRAPGNKGKPWRYFSHTGICSIYGIQNGRKFKAGLWRPWTSLQGGRRTVTPVSVELFYDGEDKEKIVPGFFGAIEGAFLMKYSLQRRKGGRQEYGMGTG